VTRPNLADLFPLEWSGEMTTTANPRPAVPVPMGDQREKEQAPFAIPSHDDAPSTQQNQ